MERVLAGVMAVVMVAAVVLALLHPGVATPRVDVDDGGIWVTNRAKQLVGHLNYEARVFDGSLRSGSGEFDVQQYRDTVTFTDAAVNAVAPLDVAGMRLGASTSLPERARAAQGGDRLGVLDAGDGMLWVVPAHDPTSTPLTEATTVATGLEGGVVNAGVDGTVAAIAALSRRMVVASPQGTGSRISTVEVAELPHTADLSLTLVGARPVALDAESNTLILPDGTLRPLTEAGVETGGVLQQPGPEADHVLIATPGSLVAVPLNGGEPTRFEPRATAAGRPAAPVRLAGCEYAAWAGSGAYVRRCDGEPEPLQMTVSTLQPAGPIQFRTNRDRIVLNDIDVGTVWLPNENMVLAADWDEIDRQVEVDDAGESPQSSEDFADPERNTTNTPPVVTPDEFGVRPGRTTTLDVLFNDSDRDGDVLTARPVGQPNWGKVSASRGGRALSIDVPADATGSTGFTYEAHDGKDLGTGPVTVTVHPESVNAAPEQLRDPGVQVGANAEVTYNVLPDWRDPDGDPVFLVRADGPQGLQVQYREEGTVAVRAAGHEPGVATLNVTVSDGREETVGTLSVRVEPAGNLPPRANGDFYVTRVGEEALLEPLANDTDPNGDSLTLARVSPPPAGTTAVPDLDVGTISFLARAEGVYYLAYGVTDGPAQASGVIRVDVVAAGGSSDVVVEDDLALLPQLGATLSAPLANDADPAGGVLVVQSVQVPPDSPLEVTLVDHHLLRITSGVTLEAPASFTYTASNGTTQASAEVMVVPTGAGDNRQPLELKPDRTRVRVGDIASVPVLANDRSPAGLTMWVDSHLEYEAAPEVGTPFVTGNHVRVQAGNTPGFLHVAYTARDSSGKFGTSTVLFEVVAEDAANAAPRPTPLTAWALSGQTVRIPVPLANIDPDGDSVTLIGIEQPPGKGTAALGTDWIEYTPAPDQTGTDVFVYRVEDRLGKQATARVRVGIAPPSGTNQHPSAVPDTLLVRPDRELAVPVLANDIDPDGDALSLPPEGLVITDQRLTATVEGTSVLVTTPSQPGAYVLSYTVSDGRGGQDTGALTLNVSPDAPLLAPQARDDVVATQEVPADGDPVSVDVLANDTDPDGDISLVRLSSASEGVRVVDDRLLITPAETRRMVVYTLTDQDGLTGSAVVSVPGTERTRPTLDPHRPRIEVRSGQEVTLDLRDHIATRPGRTPRLTSSDSVRALLGAAEPPTVLDDHRIVFRAAEDFAGETGVSVEVSDGTAEDRSALTATLTVPIQVVPSVNRPPTLTPTPLRIAAGEEAVTADLSLMVSDPDDADPRTFTYTLVNAPNSVSASLSGHLLSVKTTLDQEKGPAGSLTIGVDDGSGVVTTSIPVTVLSSTRPLVQVSDAVITAANAGGTEVVDISNYTINPFPEQPLRIQRTAVMSGEVTAVSVNGTKLSISLPSGWHGQAAVSYQVMDATGDQDRLVEGRIRLTVRDRPDAPSNVQVTATGAGSALVSFTPGADNGAPITRFTITHVGTGRTIPCTVASCPVTGLANGQRHAFSVVAHNDVGASPSSPQSAPVLVDMRPGRPNPPVCTAGNGSVGVTWTPPTNEGSAITEYTLYTSGGSGRTVTVPAGKTSFTLDQLRNGEAYRVAVQAHNKAEEPSETSEPCAPVIPFGPPPAPQSVSITHLQPDSVERAKIAINWVYPSSSNGRPWDRVRIVTAAGQRELASDGSVTSAQVEVPATEKSTVSVSLHTEGGWSPETSITFQAMSLPLAIDVPTVTATGRSGQVAVTGAQVKPGNGYRADQLSLQYSTGSDWRALSTMTLNGLPNGKAVTIRFRQVAGDAAQWAVGPSVRAQPVTPYGPPPAPTLKGTGLRDSVNFEWSTPADNGGPRVTRVDVTIDGRTTSSAELTGSRTVRSAPGESHTARVAACYADGTCTNSEPVTVAAWGTIQVAVAECTGGEVPELPGRHRECHTFRVRPNNNWVPRTDLHCAFVSDIDERRRTFRVSDHTAWTPSRLRTATDDQARLESYLGNRLICRPMP